MRLIALVALIFTIGELLPAGAVEISNPTKRSAVLLTRLTHLEEALKRLEKQSLTPKEPLRAIALSNVLQSFRLRLMRGRVVEKSSRVLLHNLADKLRPVWPEDANTEVEDALQQLLATETTEGWEAAELTSDCQSDVPKVHEAVLDDFTTRCNMGGEFYDILGCVAAATMYCQTAFPHKKFSELLGLVTNRKGNSLTVACLDRSHLIFAMDLGAFSQHCRNGCEQAGADRVCQLHYGTEYAGIYVDRVWLKTLGNDVDNYIMVGCFRTAKLFTVEYRKLQSENAECHAGNSVRNYGCLKAVSSYCKDQFGYSGGVVQNSPSPNIAEVACYSAFYTGDVYISRDNDFLDAKQTLTKVCSLDFEVEKGKILNSVPETISTGRFDNRKSSSVELRDIFTFEKSVSSENKFTHEHSMTIGIEMEIKSKVPFLVENSIKLSASYTATLSFEKTNTISTTFSYTSEVFVPPGKCVIKKAVITRSKLDVPWRAVGIMGLGQRVVISGTWQGVDVSEYHIEQEDC